MRRASRLVALSTAALLAGGLAACSSSAADEQAERGSGDFTPVTIEHALGTTTLEAKPERVATVQWANHEVPLALGVVPVGMAAGQLRRRRRRRPPAVGRRAARGARRRDAGAVRRDRRHRLRGGRRHRPRRHPRRLLGPDPGGLRHAQRDRAGRRLPRGALGDAVARHDPDQRRRHGHGRRRARSSSRASRRRSPPPSPSTRSWRASRRCS